MTMSKTARTYAAVLLGAALLSAGCGTTDAPTGAARPHAAQGAPGAGADAPAAGAPGAGTDMTGHDQPSGSASMICSDEIRDAVARTFRLSTPPTGSPTWSPSERLYTCDYRVPGGTLTLSVQDALSRSEGSAYFAGVRTRMPGARAIRGIENLGFPAVTSRTGRVAFLKDGKTLLVDASRLAKTALPRGYTRSEVAYSAASAVIGCWKE